MKIYIAGKMTGMKDHNRQAFNRADALFSALGFTVLNPARHIPLVRPDRVSHDQYMMIAKAMLDACDAIYMLDGWQESVGATMEHGWAVNMGISIWYEGGANERG